MGDLIRGKQKQVVTTAPPIVLTDLPPTVQEFQPGSDPIREAMAGLAFETGLENLLAAQGLRGSLLGAAGEAIPGVQRALQLAGEESVLPAALQAAVSPSVEALRAGAASVLGGPADLSFLEQEFREQVLPSIAGAAVRAGAVGGSAEQDLTARAVREFGRAAAAELSRQSAARLQAATPALGLAAQLGQIAPQAAAQIGGLRRQLEVQRERTPLELVLMASQGIRFPEVPTIPGFAGPTTQTSRGPMVLGGGSTTQTTSQQPILNMLAQLAALGMLGYGMFSTRLVKRDLAPVGQGALEALLKTPVYSWRYVWDHRRRVGPVVEEAPPEIRRGPFLDIPSYVGMQHAALKELSGRVSALEEALNHAAR